MDSSDKYVAIFYQKSPSFSTLKFSDFCASSSSRFESGRFKTNADSHAAFILFDQINSSNYLKSDRVFEAFNI
jgi:hypothetical protein